MKDRIVWGGFELELVAVRHGRALPIGGVRLPDVAIYRPVGQVDSEDVELVEFSPENPLIHEEKDTPTHQRQGRI